MAQFRLYMTSAAVTRGCNTKLLPHVCVSKVTATSWHLAESSKRYNLKKNFFISVGFFHPALTSISRVLYVSGSSSFAVFIKNLSANEGECTSQLTIHTHTHTEEKSQWQWMRGARAQGAASSLQQAAGVIYCCMTPKREVNVCVCVCRCTCVVCSFYCLSFAIPA
jgi:hypothetical protein